MLYAGMEHEDSRMENEGLPFEFERLIEIMDRESFEY